MTYSGRASFFKEELKADLNTSIETNTNNTNNTNSLNSKNLKPLGLDKFNNVYYSWLTNKDCKIFIENNNKTLTSIVSNYEELESFLSKFENSKNANEIAMIKNIRENLLLYKEYDEENKKRDIIFQRKLQVLEKSKMMEKEKLEDINKYSNSDYYLMNISDHVITRNQLSQINKVNNVVPLNQLRGSFTIEGEKKNIIVQFTLTPENPPLIQEYHIKEVNKE